MEPFRFESQLSESIGAMCKILASWTHCIVMMRSSLGSVRQCYLGVIVSRHRWFSTHDEYQDENTRIKRPLLFQTLRVVPDQVKASHEQHLSKQAGLLLVGHTERLSEKFKAVEEAKWANKEKRAKRESPSSNVPPETKATNYHVDRVVPLLEKLKTMEVQEVIREDFLAAALSVANEDDGDALGPATMRVGVLGLSNAYYAEDHGQCAKLER
jgi:hypothetical protein